MTVLGWTVVVWALALIVWGALAILLVDRARWRREQAGHAVGRAHWCPLCGYTFVDDDIVARAIGTDGAAVVHADDCGPRPGRVKLAQPTHTLTGPGVLTRREL